MGNVIGPTRNVQQYDYQSGIGGLAGYNGSMVTSSYASGNVSGGINVGGLVGWNPGHYHAVDVSGNVSAPHTLAGSGGTITAQTRMLTRPAQSPGR